MTAVSHLSDTPAYMPNLTPKMKAEKQGHIGWLIFNQPEKRNAVSTEMWEAIPQIIKQFVSDPEIRVIILKGEGTEAFVSGADISQFEKVRSGLEDTRKYDESTAEAYNAIYTCEKPTIGMIRGYCIGGGLGIAICCDMRIATEKSRFGVPAAKLGVGYGMSGVKKLVDLVGPAYAREIFYTARQFNAEEALQMRLVNRVLAEEEMEAYVLNYATTISNNAPLTIRAVKETVNSLCQDPPRDEAAVQAFVEACFASEDYKEGRRAFMEKRKAQFIGK